MAGTGLPPKCASCGSLERHRVVRQVYDALPDDLLHTARVLQFSDDPATPKDRFRLVEVSLFGRDNSLDMSAIDRSDASYDWIIANHVLEHVPNDYAAICELLRIVTDDGVIQLSVPTPSTALETWELAQPDPKSFDHWRGYGSDLPLRLANELGGCFGLQVICHDEPTQGWDVVYLFTKSRQTMLTVGNALLKAGLPTLRSH
jgi:SAM-dependent methyltransferase